MSSLVVTYFSTYKRDAATNSLKLNRLAACLFLKKVLLTCAIVIKDES